jgi:hypothetical protein
VVIPKANAKGNATPQLLLGDHVLAPRSFETGVVGPVGQQPGDSGRHRTDAHGSPAATRRSASNSQGLRN